MSDDIIKDAAQFVCVNIPGVRPSHAHAAVAHALGYNSKKALLDDDDPIIQNPNLVLNVDLDETLLTERVGQMRDDTPLKTQEPRELIDVIYAGLAPRCCVCGCKSMDIEPVGADDDPGEWVCSACSGDDEEFGQCIYCDRTCRIDDLTNAGECPIHAGESSMDEEEAEDWESLIENMTKDL